MYNELKNKTCQIKMTKDGDSEEIEVQFDNKANILEAINKLENAADDLLNPIGLDMLNTFDSSKKKKHKKRKKTKDDSVDIEDTTVIKDEEITLKEAYERTKSLGTTGRVLQAEDIDLYPLLAKYINKDITSVCDALP